MVGNEPRLSAPTESPATFVGIDLAWGTRNPTGGAVIREGHLVACTGLLRDDASILQFIQDHVGCHAPCIVAVDAPLCVPNETSRRPCDAELSRDYGPFEAGALPANRSIALFQPEPRGERLVRSLADKLLIRETAHIDRHDRRRLVCEVFPHPAHVMLFGLDKTLKYKKRRHRKVAALAAALVDYRSWLETLSEADPPLRGLECHGLGEPLRVKGAARKELEDTLDAVTCAYVASWAWTHGPEGQRWYGSLETGSILTPWKREAATAKAIAAKWTIQV